MLSVVLFPWGLLCVLLIDWILFVIWSHKNVPSSATRMKAEYFGLIFGRCEEVHHPFLCTSWVCIHWHYGLGRDVWLVCRWNIMTSALVQCLWCHCRGFRGVFYWWTKSEFFLLSLKAFSRWRSVTQSPSPSLIYWYISVHILGASQSYVCPLLPLFFIELSGCQRWIQPLTLVLRTKTCLNM